MESRLASAVASVRGGDANTDGVLSNEDIMLMLQQREQARANRDFESADRIRAELLNRGVHINDKVRTWTSSDGRAGMRPSARGGIVLPTEPFPSPAQPEQHAPPSTQLQSLAKQEIEQQQPSSTSCRMSSGWSVAN